MNHSLETKWLRIRGKAKEFWGELSGDDRDWIAGRREQLISQLEEHYGMSREEAEQEVDTFIDRMI